MASKQKFDLSIPRRMYLRVGAETRFCPECNSELQKDSCVIVLYVESNIDKGEFVTNVNGSRFCTSCPVVVFDREKVEKAAKLGIKGEGEIVYMIMGIIDLEAVPEDKHDLELGTDENPIPLVGFLPDLTAQPVRKEKKVGRNEPCPCGSGKKYKKCCGRVTL